MGLVVAAGQSVTDPAAGAQIGSSSTGICSAGRFNENESSLVHSKPKSTVSTPSYIAPEVFSPQEYDSTVSYVVLPNIFRVHHCDCNSCLVVLCN